MYCTPGIRGCTGVTVGLSVVDSLSRPRWVVLCIFHEATIQGVHAIRPVVVRNPYFLYLHLSLVLSSSIQFLFFYIVRRYCGKCAGQRERMGVGAIVCVLHTRSLTRIYIGVHQHTRTGRHYYKIRVCANPFVPRFCSFFVVVVVYRDHVASARSLFSQSRREFLFLFASLPWSLATFRQKFSDSWMQTRVPRPNSNHVTHRVIDRSFERGRSCFTGLSFYDFFSLPPSPSLSSPPPNIRYSFARRLRKEQRDRSFGSSTSFTSFTK